MVGDYNDKSNLFEVCMCELIRLDQMHTKNVAQYFGLWYPYRSLFSYEEKIYETFDIIPGGFFRLQEKSLADKLLNLLATLESDSRERQIDIWDAELALDSLKYLERRSNFNAERIKELLIDNLACDEIDWDRDWSAHSFLREHHQYRSTKENDCCHYLFWDQLLP